MDKRKFIPRTPFILMLVVIIVGFWYLFGPVLKNIISPPRSTEVNYPAPESDIEQNYPGEPEQVLSEYLRLDYEGASLSKNGVELLKMLNEKNLYIEQRKNLISVINKYTITDTDIGKSEASITIEWELIGKVKGYALFERDEKRVSQRITLDKVNGVWKISTVIWPHVHWDTMLKYLKMREELIGSRGYSNVFPLIKDYLKKKS